MSGASERANGQASGPVLTSRFFALLTHRGLSEEGDRNKTEEIRFMEKIRRKHLFSNLGEFLAFPAAECQRVSRIPRMRRVACAVGKVMVGLHVQLQR